MALSCDIIINDGTGPYLARYLLQYLLFRLRALAIPRRPLINLLVEAIFTETPQYPGSFIALFVQAGRPERFGSEFVGELVDRRTKLIGPTPDLVEAGFAVVFGYPPCRVWHDGPMLSRSSR